MTDSHVNRSGFARTVPAEQGHQTEVHQMNMNTISITLPNGDVITRDASIDVEAALIRLRSAIKANRGADKAQDKARLSAMDAAWETEQSYVAFGFITTPFASLQGLTTDAAFKAFKASLGSTPSTLSMRRKRLGEVLKRWESDLAAQLTGAANAVSAVRDVLGVGGAVTVPAPTVADLQAAVPDRAVSAGQTPDAVAEIDATAVKPLSLWESVAESVQSVERDVETLIDGHKLGADDALSGIRAGVMIASLRRIADRLEAGMALTVQGPETPTDEREDGPNAEPPIIMNRKARRALAAAAQ